MRFYQFLFSAIILFVACNPSKDHKTTDHMAQDETSAVTSLYDYNVEEKLKGLGIKLQEPKPYNGLPIEHYVLIDNMLYLSGKGPVSASGERITGKVGKDLNVEEGRHAARQIAIAQLEVIKSVTGDLNKVKQVVKVLGMVNATEDFKDHPKVINGFSELMIDAFGERGRHARSAVGMASLPSGIACEIEMIVEIQK